MKTILIQFITITVSFAMSYEFLSWLNAGKSHLRAKDESFTYVDASNDADVYFIGDSYASTTYVDNPYPMIFRDHFKARGMNFYDYTEDGSELNTHKRLLDSIGAKEPELVIYFYNISDIVSLNSDLLLVNNREIDIDSENDSSIKNDNFEMNDIIAPIYNSHTVELAKKITQFLTFKMTGKYLKGTPSYRFPIENKLHADALEELFDSIKAKQVIILINSPFNANPESKNWDHYAMFKNLAAKKEYKVLMAADIIDDPKYSVSWRNAHPNQEAIEIIASQVIKNLD